MIPVFIFWLIKHYREKNKNATATAVPKKTKKYLPLLAAILLLFILLIFSTNSYSQNKTLNYQIIRNGSKVGTLLFSETSTGDLDHLKMESDVKTRFIFTFTAHASEEAVYNNGILLRSSIYRRLNDSEKANKQHQVTGNRQYLIRTGEDQSSQKPILLHTIC